ncbi:MAG: hypothetical protein R2764_02830 [Bacteroidales bacterium]
MRETSGDVTAATPATMISRKAGFVLKDGTIVSIDGVSPINFDVSVTQNIYTVKFITGIILLLSLQCLVPMVGDSYTYDFSSGMDKVYGGILGHKEMSGIWGMPRW